MKKSPAETLRPRQIPLRIYFLITKKCKCNQMCSHTHNSGEMVCGQKFLARPTGLKTCSGSGISVMLRPGRLLDDEWYGGGGTVQGAQDDGQPPRLQLLLQAAGQVVEQLLLQLLHPRVVLLLLTAVLLLCQLCRDETAEISTKTIAGSVADPDPGSGAFLTPGSGIGFFRIPDPIPIFLRA